MGGSICKKLSRPIYLCLNLWYNEFEKVCDCIKKQQKGIILKINVMSEVK